MEVGEFTAAVIPFRCALISAIGRNFCRSLLAGDKFVRMRESPASRLLQFGVDELSILQSAKPSQFHPRREPIADLMWRHVPAGFRHGLVQGFSGSERGEERKRGSVDP